MTNPILKEVCSNQRFVYFDLETIPCQDPDYMDVLKRNIKPPKTLKKQESIDAWIADKLPAATSEAFSKTSFDGGRGHICTIAWAKNDSPVAVRHAPRIEDEREVIEAFFADLDPRRHEILVGHNITGFDIGFLLKRAIVLGIRLPDKSRFPRDPKPWDKSVHDTMAMWAGGTGRISINDLCDILGIKGKNGFDGSMVAGAWLNGEHEKIAEYCQEDVSITRAIHQRFLEVGW